MENIKKIRVLHIVRDDKFIDYPLSCFEQDGRFENKSILIVKSPGYKFRLIKKTDSILLLHNKRMVRDVFQKGEYDVIFFYSLRANLWRYFKYIPKNKIVIWWAWGFDIYEGARGLEPLIKMKLYKNETSKLFADIKSSYKNQLARIYRFFTVPYYLYLRKKVLSRIDYFQPVWKIEYDIIKDNYPCFHAKEFYYSHSYNKGDNEVEKHSDDGNIIVGNSATPTNNHLDVLKLLSGLKNEKQKIIVPLSYGDPSYKEKMINKMGELPYCDDIMPLYSFLPANEYWNLFNSCSYACFGHMRQQGGGNIEYALLHGIKVYLYKDSIAYQQHINNGFEVFALEDADESSFATSINEEQAKRNLVAIKREYERRQAVYEACVMEIINSIVS